MKPFFSKDTVEVYLAPIAQSPGSRRERERAAVDRLLQAIFGHTIVLTHNEAGAPLLSGRAESISVSHSRLTAAIAIDHSGKAIGIDIEETRQQLQRVAPRVLSTAEMGKYGASLESLAQAWTLKEAAYKCAGIPGLDFRKDIILESDNMLTVAGQKTEILFSATSGVEFMSLVRAKTI